jgi:carbon monoxide dehydrogenase subunit G
MQLAHEFTVNTPIERAWAVLTDVERIAPCMPGAELTEVDGDTYHGLVKVKVGPITAQYKGTASFVEKDEAAHRAVLKAAGRDARGQGNASATVTAVMTEQGDGTRVEITTDMTVSGRVAQFGRGVMADVTARLLQQFVDNLEADVLAPAGKGEAASAGDAAVPPIAPPGCCSSSSATSRPTCSHPTGREKPPARAMPRGKLVPRPPRMPRARPVPDLLRMLHVPPEPGLPRPPRRPVPHLSRAPRASRSEWWGWSCARPCAGPGSSSSGCSAG